MFCDDKWLFPNSSIIEEFFLVSPCLFWTIICSVIAFYYSECTLLELGKSIVFPMTETGLWFIKAYFALYLLAPLLNSGINNMCDRQLKWSCMMLIIVDVYIGYMHQSKEITIDGYHLVHFITLYVLASTLRRLHIERFKSYKLMGGGNCCCYNHDSFTYV